MNRAPARNAARIISRALILVAVFAAAGLANPTPSLGTSFDVDWDATVANSSPGANSDVTFQLDIPAPSANFGGLVSFMPPEFSIALDANVPNGAVAGTISAAATLGLVNGSCSTALDIEFRMMEAETDPDNWIYHYDGLYDYNGDALPENVVRSPQFMGVLFPNLQPIQRLYGQSLVASQWVAVNFFIFEPGAPLPLLPDLDPALGYPIVITLDDPTSTILPGTITDFCSPLSTMTVLRGVTRDHPDTAAGEGGRILRTNPTESGAYSALLFARSRWDADDDGIENELDPCPYDPDPAWDPRAQDPAGDSDQDGLPNSCDPNDGLSNFDHDGDGLLNRQDRCPRTVDQYEAADSDRDGVGDACDRAPEDPADGGLNHRHDACVAAVIEIGSGGDPPAPPVCPAGPDRPIPPRFRANSYRFLPQGGVQSLSVNILKPLVYEGIPGVEVHFNVSGAHNLIGKCLTNANGDCQFNYQGSNVGDDTIEVTAVADGIDLADILVTTWVAPPLNDRFADAFPVDVLPFEDGQNSVAATRELNEPLACQGVENTYWYRFDPLDDGYLHIETPGDTSTLVLGAFRGSTLADLEPIACATPRYYYPGPFGRNSSIEPSCCGGPPPPSETYLSMPVEGGATYYFQAASYGYEAGEQAIEFEALTFGDTNCTDDMDTLDALAILRYSAGLVTDEDELECVEYGDLSCDGAVNSYDALLMLRRLAGLEVFINEVCASSYGF